MDVSKRIATLRRRIDTANHEYYILDRPTLHDAAYDALLRELQELEATHPDQVTPDSPTQRVGTAPSSRFAPVTHAAPMLSLGNAFSTEELRAFDQRVRKALGRDDVGYVCELKIDGLAIDLAYVDGRFVQGATRGDGTRMRSSPGYKASTPPLKKYVTCAYFSVSAIRSWARPRFARTSPNVFATDWGANAERGRYTSPRTSSRPTTRSRRVSGIDLIVRRLAVTSSPVVPSPRVAPWTKRPST